MRMNSNRYTASALHGGQYGPFGFDDNSAWLIIKLSHQLSQFAIVGANLYGKGTLSRGWNKLFKWKDGGYSVTKAKSIQAGLRNDDRINGAVCNFAYPGFNISAHWNTFQIVPVVFKLCDSAKAGGSYSCPGR